MQCGPLLQCFPARCRQRPGSRATRDAWLVCGHRARLAGRGSRKSDQICNQRTKWQHVIHPSKHQRGAKQLSGVPSRRQTETAKQQEARLAPGEQRVRQLDVLDDGLVLVPLRLDGVGGGEDGGARVQLTDDSRLGDRQRLLLL